MELGEQLLQSAIPFPVDSVFMRRRSVMGLGARPDRLIGGENYSHIACGSKPHRTVEDFQLVSPQFDE